MKMFGRFLALSALTFVSLQLPAHAEDEKKGETFSVAEDKLSFTAPGSWVKKQPRTKIVDHEFAIPAVGDDKEDGRLTVMGAGGAIDDNISRWVGQFSQPDGKNTRDFTKVEKKTIAGQEVRLIDITGTYKDSPGPFAGGQTVERPDYRMLAAIVVTEKDGNYFLKLYGPKKTIAENEAAFQKMVESLQKK